MMNFSEYEAARQRTQETIKARENDRLEKQLREASRVPRRGMGIRVTAFVMALFRV
ncbi:hypothetical protein BH18ACT10_BH18ACT10_10940 [soil metagenome]